MSEPKAFLFAGQLNPAEVLEYYRQQSPLPLKQDVQMFKKMPIEDRLELMFWLCLHLNISVGSILASSMDTSDEQRH